MSANVWTTESPSAVETMPTVELEHVRTDSHAASKEMSYQYQFWILCAAHFLIWVIVPFLTQHNASLDLIEMLYWGREWQLGYHKHPPLPAWTSQALSEVFGSVIWPSLVVSQLCIVACLWSVWSITRSAFGNRAALVSAMMLEGCYYYHYTTPEFNNNSLSRTFWALTIAFVFHALSRKQTRYWVLAGITLSLGLLSKYDCAILAITMLFFSFVHPMGRRAWRTPGPYLAGAVAVLIFLPHLYWLSENSFSTITYLKSRAESETTLISHLSSPLRFLLTQGLAIAPMLLIAWPVLGTKWQRRSEKDAELTFARDFVLIFALTPLAIVLGAGFVTGAQLQSMWGSALFTFAGATVVALFRISESREKALTSWKLAFGLCGVAAVALIVHDIVLPNVTGKMTRVNFPGRELGKYVDEISEVEFPGKLPYIGGPRWVAGNAAFYSQDRPSVYPNLDPEINSWVDDELFRNRGGLIVWNEFDYVAEDLQALQKRFPQMQMLPSVSLDACDWDMIPPTRIYVAVVPAKQTAEPNSTALNWYH